MSVYNGEKYLREAIDSILNQTFKDFEFIIINDGSTDRTAQILKSYHNPRIKIINNQKNLGLTKSLNIGIKRARGEYIARQDADDVSLPTRLERQLSYLEAHSNVVILGIWAQVIDEKGNFLWKMCPPTNPLLLKWRMLFKNNLIHSAVMFEAKKIKQLGGYNLGMAQAQDYDLWSRVMMCHDIAQLPEILIHWRIHPGSISTNYFNDQIYTADRTACSNIQYLLNREVSLEGVRDLRTLLYERSLSSAERLNRKILNNRSPSSAKCLYRASNILHDVYITVMDQWKPNFENSRIITKDYASTIKTIASMHANIKRKGTFHILKKAIQANKASIFDASIIKCILKIFLGPSLVSKYHSYFKRFHLS